MAHAAMQCVAVCCSVLRYIIALCCSVLQRFAVCILSLYCHCSLSLSLYLSRSRSLALSPALSQSLSCLPRTYPLQHTATPCNILQHSATHCTIMHHTATTLERTSSLSLPASFSPFLSPSLPLSSQLFQSFLTCHISHEPHQIFSIRARARSLSLSF